MTELHESELPPPAGIPVEFVKQESASLAPDEEAPYGRKADGTPKKRPGRPAGSGGGSRTPSMSAEKLQEEIADLLGEALIPIAFISPLAGAVIDERVDKTAHGLTVLMGNSPRVKKWIQKSVKAKAVQEILALPVGIVIALNVERGNMAPDHFVSRKFNLPEHINTLYSTGVYKQRSEPEVEPEMNGHVRSGLFDE